MSAGNVHAGNDRGKEQLFQIENVYVSAELFILHRVAGVTH